MSENFGFIKKYRSSKSKDLKRKHVSSFLVLDTLAENVKRTLHDGHPLLEIGEGIITAEECGLTSQQFETGIKYLVNEGQIEVIHRGRKDQNSKIENRKGPESKTDSPRITSRIKPRINGTVLKLLNTDIYDPNFESTPNHIPNQKRIRPESHPEQTRNIRNKEIKETTTPLPPKVAKSQDRVVVVDFFDQLEKELNIKSDSPKHDAPKLFFESSEMQHNIHYQDKIEFKFNKQSVNKTLDIPNKQQISISPLLENIEIPIQDKLEISLKYSEEIIKHALESSKTVKDMKCLPAYLKYACKNRPQIRKSKEDLEKEKKEYVENNRLFADPFDTAVGINGIRLDVLSKRVEFVCGSFCEALEFSDREFRTKFIDNTKKYGIIIPNEIKNKAFCFA